MNTATFSHSKVKKTLLVGIGSVSMTSGIVGIFVPIWPTTCFLLLSVACFSKSSPRLHAWILTNRFFGRYITQYKESRTLENRVIVVSLSSLWAALAISAWLVQPPVWVALIMLSIGLAITLHLLTLKPADA